MRLGYFTMPLHPMERSCTDTLQVDREAIILADKLGFYDAFVGEHLTEKTENVTNSLLFLATLISDTKTIKLGTGTSNLSQQHPVLFASHAAMFDHLAKGRFIFGVSAGALRCDAEALGNLDQDRNKMFAECIDVILAIWQRESPYDIDLPDNRYKVTVKNTRDLLIGRGHLYKPYQQPRPEIVGTVVAPYSKGVTLMGQRDFHPLSANFLFSKWLPSHWANYSEGKRKAGQIPNAADWRIARTIFVADDDKVAKRYGRDDANSPYRYYWKMRIGLRWALVALSCASAPQAFAQTEEYPARPIRLVTPTAAGSGSDVVARIVSVKLSETLGRQIVVDNRSGVSGLLAAELVAKAAPDGYTLGMVTLLMATVLYQRFLADREFVPVTRVGSTPFIIVASPALPVKTIPELIAYAKARPGQVLYASGGQGSTPHMCAEMFKSMAGVDLLHVPYKSSIFAVTELASGQVHLLCSAIPTLHATIQAAKVRPLGVTSREPSKLAPGVPAIAATVPGFEMDGWYGIIAPQGTPKEIVVKLNGAFTQVLKLPEVQERLLGVGAEALTSTPAAFGDFLRSETQRWSKVMRDAGIKPQ